MALKMGEICGNLKFLRLIAENTGEKFFTNPSLRLSPLFSPDPAGARARQGNGRGRVSRSEESCKKIFCKTSMLSNLARRRAV